MKTFAATALAAIAMAGKLKQNAAEHIEDDGGYALYNCVDVNGDGMLSFREMVKALYVGEKNGAIPKDVVRSFRSNIYIHPMQFAMGVYGALEEHGVPIGEWVPILNDTAVQLSTQQVTGKGMKWFERQLDAPAFAQTKDGHLVLGFSEEAEAAVGEFEAAIEALWNACDKNGNGKMQATELLYCLNEGHRDEVYDSSVSQSIFENIRVGPQLAELAVIQTLAGAQIPEDQWGAAVAGAAASCQEGRAAGLL